MIAELSEAEIATLAKALHEAETTGGFWGEHPECQEFAEVARAAVQQIVDQREKTLRERVAVELESEGLDWMYISDAARIVRGVSA